MDIVRQLENTQLFQGVLTQSLSDLAARAVYKTYGAQAVVLSEAQPVKSFYLILTGKLKLFKISPDGREQTLQLLGPGDPFGLCTAFATESFPASAVALEPSTLLSVPGPQVEAIALREPKLLLNIISILSRRLKESMTLIESLSLKDLPARIASFLRHELSRGAPGQTHLTLSLSQRELAKILGATPEALSRTLRKMSDDGLIRVSGRDIDIQNRPALEILSGDPSR